MEIQVTDLFQGQTQTFSGNPMEIEKQLRVALHRALAHVPHGDLQGLLDAVERMHGYSVVVKDAVNYAPPKRKFISRPTLTDTWVRRELSPDKP